MFNRIRRAVSRTSERYFPKGQHRRPLTPVRSTVVHLGLADSPTLYTGRLRDGMDLLAAEEIALVRPYVLASGEGAKGRSTAAAHTLFAQTWSAPPEVA
ncbi:hypothetical protein ACWD6R_32090 [Streptomyces sp. NPDC005151]